MALITDLTSLRHSNGQPVITLYGPATTEGHGGTLTSILALYGCRPITYN